MKQITKKPLPKYIYPAYLDASMVVFCFSFDPEVVRLAADDLARLIIQEASIKLQISNESKSLEE